MPKSYESIPTTEPKDIVELGSEEAPNRNCYCYILLSICVGLVIFMASAPTPKPNPKLPDEPMTEHWPKRLIKIDAALNVPNLLPANTTGLYDEGWRKTGEPCDPMLGESWTYGGERSSNYSAAIYLTPQIGDVPGVVSGIEVDFYGYVPEKQIGTFYGEGKISKDGLYRSISVALRNGEVENLCDTETPVAPGNPEYVKVSPGMANLHVPVVEDPDLLGEWKEGSCLPFMGYHWSKFLEGGDELPYKAENLAPVQVMYNRSSEEKTINGIFFSAADKMQKAWPEECEGGLNDCSLKKVNFWDNSPGLLQETILRKRFFMCSNFCGPCEFEGTANEYFTTMHWFFRDTLEEKCGGSNPRPHCREGDWAGISHFRLMVFVLAKKYLMRLIYAVGAGLASFYMLMLLNRLIVGH